eukprot:5631555-Pleurochrysis_carterae.AAC.4
MCHVRGELKCVTCAESSSVSRARRAQAQAHHRALEELRKAHDVELKKLQEQHQTRLNDWMQQIYEARQERDAARDRATQLANECNDLRVELSAKQMVRHAAPRPA